VIALSRPRRKAVTSKGRLLKSRALRIAVVALSLIGLAAGVGAALGKVAKPYLIGRTEGAEIAQIKQEIAQQERRRGELMDDMRYLRTPAGMEVEARRLGWVKEGEVSVVVEEPKPEPTVEESSKKPFLQRFSDGVVGLFGAGKKD